MKHKKPFLTIEEQIKLLRSRGIQIDTEADSILMCCGYYPLINGYKEPFIDPVRTAKAGDDRFKFGTKLSDIYALFKFDSALRRITLPYLLEAESLVKTACAYTFSEMHPGYEDYLDQNNFADEDEYLRASDSKSYLDELTKLHSKLRYKAQHSKREPIVHYRNNHGGVPFWVLTLDVTFGEIEYFFNFMKPNERNEVCHRIVKATGKLGFDYEYLSPRQASININTLVKARNMCAHGERFYCGKFGARKQDSFSRMSYRLSTFLSEETDSQFTREIVREVAQVSTISDVVSHILENMGFGSIADKYKDL